MIQVPTALWAHPVFDLLAWGGGIGVSAALYRWRLRGLAQDLAAKAGGGYFAALLLGAAPGAWLAGSLNTLRYEQPVLSHSVVGALVGAIAGIEIYKALRGIKGSTGGVFVGSFAFGVMVGRLGCFFTGLADNTFGSPTTLPWAVDLGDGVGRHPVQLYESACMALFLAAYLLGLKARAPWAMRRGFYALCIWYGLQRFCWEFLKPYPRLIGPFTVFHILCLGLVVYGWLYDRADRRRERDAQAGALSVPRPDHEPLRDLS
jgi:hypothetical protein